jgi:hypothetical protein
MPTPRRLTGTPKDGLAEFRSFAKDVRSLWGIAIGGPVILPVLAAFADIAPPWPKQPSVIAAALMLLTLLVTYFCFTRLDRISNAPKILILSAGIAVFALIAYLALLNTFVFAVPTTGEKIVLGCGFTSNAQLVANKFGFALGGDCPGDDYVNLLSNAQYNSYEIWKKWSLTAITIMLFGLWALFFVGITICLGTFVISQKPVRRSKTRALNPTQPPSGA